jgi:Spx/MgsR family transcriptional regulator
MHLYGIKNCDTVKKARKWLDEHEVAYEFHDFRDGGLNPIQLREWVGELGWEVLVNKRSTTWRNLPDETKENMDEMLALAVMEDQPTLIKRPVLVTASKTLVGFSEKTYQSLLAS